jgi:hypothetical protein
MKVTLLLRHDHELLRSLMDRFKNAGTNEQSRRHLFQEIRHELLNHAQLAAETLYSALAATPSDRAVELVENAQERAGAVESLTEELNRMSSSDRHFDSKMKALFAEIEWLIEEEEERIFQEARKTLPEYRLEELGLDMQHRREMLRLLAVV